MLPEEQPGPNLRKNFYTMLESYKEGLNRESLLNRFVNFFKTWFVQPQRAVYQLAFTVIILITGFAAGFIISSGSSNAVHEYKEEMAQLSSQVEKMVDKYYWILQIKSVSHSGNIKPGRILIGLA